MPHVTQIKGCLSSRNGHFSPFPNPWLADAFRQPASVAPGPRRGEAAHHGGEAAGRGGGANDFNVGGAVNASLAVKSAISRGAGDPPAGAVPSGGPVADDTQSISAASVTAPGERTVGRRRRGSSAPSACTGIPQVPSPQGVLRPSLFEGGGRMVSPPRQGRLVVGDRGDDSGEGGLVDGVAGLRRPRQR